MPPDACPEPLYHLSQTAGLRVFHPRRCWFSADRRCSGMLDERTAPPPGCTVQHAVFAGEARLVRFFGIPTPMKRFSIRRTGAACAGAAALGLEPGRGLADEILVVERRDREEIRIQRMHLYAFDPAPFTRYPSGEYVAGQAVVPLSERPLADPEIELAAHGVQVHYVADIERSFLACLAQGAIWGVVANIIASRCLLEPAPPAG